jgi:hypothetical protein
MPLDPQAPHASAAIAASKSGTSPFAGRWTYRSYVNDPALVGDDANKALGLIFAEAVFTFEIPTSSTLSDMSSGQRTATSPILTLQWPHSRAAPAGREASFWKRRQREE